MLTSKRRGRLQAILIWLFLGFSWGAGYVIARFVTRHGIAPISFSFYLSIGPALLLMLYLLLRRIPLHWRSLTYWRFYLVSAVFGAVIPNTNMYVVASHLPAGTLAMMINISPIFVYPLALCVGQEQFIWRRFLGVLLGVAALLMMTLPVAELHEITRLHWLLLALISPISFSLLTVYIAKYRPTDADSVALSTGMLLCAAVILVPIMLLFVPHALHLSVLHLVSGLVLLQIVLSALGTVLLFYLIKIAGPVFFSLVSCLVVLAGVFWGWLCFSEPISVMILLPLCLIVGAIVLVS